MSQQANIKAINAILNPHMHQVIGSTPTGVKDALKKSGIKGNHEAGVGLAALAIFSASVNKSTMEAVASSAELSSSRSVIMNSMSISGKTNMTAMTLLGHALLTTSISGEIEYSAAFRNKMGQNHLWAGNLESGQLGEVQKKIMKEKKDKTDKATAMLLGSGFWKYVGIDRTPMSDDEAAFWGEQPRTQPARSVYNAPQTPARTQQQGSPSSQPSPPRAQYTTFTHPDGTTDQIDSEALEYYLAVNGGDTEAASASIKKRTAAVFSEMYRKVSRQDPERKGMGAHSVVGS